MNYLETPGLPTAKVKRVIIDYRTDEKIVSALNKLGIIAYPSCEILSLYEAVKGHSDMSICHVGGNTFVCEPSSYEYYKKLLNFDDINLICGDTHLTDTYPYDIAYNVAWISQNKVLHKTAYTDRKIRENTAADFINVAQGYTKCNACIVSENALITQDNSIYINAQKAGINTLKTDNGNIFLQGFEYGFIGGASGLISDDTLAITGNVEKLVDFERIVAFCNDYGVKVISLTDENPVDIGSIIPISYD